MVKKHQIALMLNKGTSTSPVWTRIKKSTELTISMNPVSYTHLRAHETL